MITGKVTGTLDAVIEMEVAGSDQREKIEAVIDTGFYGFLVLPSDLIKSSHTPTHLGTNLLSSVMGMRSTLIFILRRYCGMAKNAR